MPRTCTTALIGVRSAPNRTGRPITLVGPAAQPPSHRGFGLTLIERSVAHELDGRVDFDFREEGLRCEIRIPYVPSGARATPDGAGPA